MRGGFQRKRAPSLLQRRKRYHSFPESEEEGAPPLSPSLRESRHSFSEIEGGMPSTLPMKESCHSFSEREGEGQPSLLPEKGGGDEVPLTSIREEEEESIILSMTECHHSFFEREGLRERLAFPSSSREG